MITAAFVRDCKPRAKMYEVTCDALPGFILRVLPSGKKVALVRYRVDGSDHRERIGLLGPDLSIDEARRRAAVRLSTAAVDAAADEPASPPAAATPAQVVQPEPRASKTLTVRELAERFIRVHVDVHLKDGTADFYRHLLRTVIIPAFGDRDFRTITRADVAELHGTLKHRPGAANNMLCVLGSLYSRAIDDWDLADMRNPARGVKKFRLRKRERFLTPEERQRVRAVIEAGLRTPNGLRGHISQASVWALDLLALTGRRRNEIMTLTWPMVDWQHSVLNLPDTKTGALKVPVSARVLALLKQIHDQTGNPRSGYVLRTTWGTRLRNINRTWERIRDAAGITDVRLHDLRHSFASDALMSGVPLAVVGELLGHKQARTTQRYAHLANHVVREALEITTSRIVDASASPTNSRTTFAPMRDEQWKAIAEMVERTRGRSGGPRTNLRRTVDGIRWVLHTGANWRQLPRELGAATTCWRWYERWSSDGTWQRIESALRPKHRGGSDVTAR